MRNINAGAKGLRIAEGVYLPHMRYMLINVFYLEEVVLLIIYLVFI
jgi:hypothetical protein